MERLHALLRRQLKRHSPPCETALDPLHPLLDSISQAYSDFDIARQMAERALQLSSIELREANAELVRALDALAVRTEDLEAEKREMILARAKLLELTRRDVLTGLLNRMSIFERMQYELENAQQTGTPLAIAMADLDSFKVVNDKYGHVVGDTVLRECARRITGVVRSVDAVGRYGGEELLIVMPGLHPSRAEARMENLRCAVADRPVVHDSVELSVTCSFGVAWLGTEPTTPETLVSLADAALYLAKNNGRNRVEYDMPSQRKQPEKVAEPNGVAGRTAIEPSTATRKRFINRAAAWPD
jgi:diguanylate cyclase (GGDEF)-like protein